MNWSDQGVDNLRHPWYNGSVLHKKEELPFSETEYIKYIVKNLDSKEEFPFDFRSEATEFFDDLVREHGDTMELELSVRIRHHVPSEIAHQDRF